MDCKNKNQTTMRKNFITLTLLILGISCSVSPKHYQGYIYSTKKNHYLILKFANKTLRSVPKQMILVFLELKKTRTLLII